jgi:hypothetical protein
MLSANSLNLSLAFSMFLRVPIWLASALQGRHQRLFLHAPGGESRRIRVLDIAKQLFTVTKSPF